MRRAGGAELEPAALRAGAGDGPRDPCAISTQHGAQQAACRRGLSLGGRGREGRGAARLFVASGCSRRSDEPLARRYLAGARRGRALLWCHTLGEGRPLSVGRRARLLNRQEPYKTFGAQIFMLFEAVKKLGNLLRGAPPMLSRNCNVRPGHAVAEGGSVPPVCASPPSKVGIAARKGMPQVGLPPALHSPRALQAGRLPALRSPRRANDGTTCGGFFRGLFCRRSSARAQGKLSLTKPERSKPKHVPRGDQQKLRKGGAHGLDERACGIGIGGRWWRVPDCSALTSWIDHCRVRPIPCADRVFKAKIAKKQDEMRASNELTKKIVGRIEATMAARASTDGAGLSMLKPDGERPPLPTSPHHATHARHQSQCHHTHRAQS